MALKQSPGSLTAPDGSYYVVISDGAGNLAGGTGTIPSGATFVSATSGNVAAAVATAVLPATSGKTTYLSGFQIFGAGATAASVVNATVTSLGGGATTITYPVVAVLGATVPNTPVVVTFSPAIPATTTNQTITGSCPSLGAGNTNNCLNMFGYQI